jgi:hypothetical protein
LTRTQEERSTVQENNGKDWTGGKKTVRSQEKRKKEIMTGKQEEGNNDRNHESKKDKWIIQGSLSNEI